MPVSTSRNLTVVGIATIVGAVTTALVAIFDGNPATNPDWNVVALAVVSGISNIMAKGAASTGGTVDGAGKPVEPAP